MVKVSKNSEICPKDSMTKNSHDYGKAGVASVLFAASEEEQTAQRFQTCFRNKAIQCSSRMGSASAVEEIRAHCQMKHWSSGRQAVHASATEPCLTGSPCKDNAEKMERLARKAAAPQRGMCPFETTVLNTLRYLRRLSGRERERERKV